LGVYGKKEVVFSEAKFIAYDVWEQPEKAGGD
jgi:hypothetical protein